MKKIISIVMVFYVLFPVICFASEQELLLGNGISVITTEKHEETDSYIADITYPVFSCNDAGLQSYLTQSITDKILALPGSLSILSEGEQKPLITVSYHANQASFDPESLFSIYVTGSVESGDGFGKQSFIFSNVILLTEKREITIGELFDADDAIVTEMINDLVYQKVQEDDKLLPKILSADDLPEPEYFALIDGKLCILYPQDQVFHSSILIGISLDELKPLEINSFHGIPEEPEEQHEEQPEEQYEEQNEEQTAEPTQEADMDGSFSFVEPDYEQPTPAPAATLDPQFSLSPVVTPTPMPLDLTDYEILNVLAHGLWKPLGSDGTQYYQFTEDGKLLTITVESFSLEDGEIMSDSLNGTIDIGSDSAFTFQDLQGKRSGYVLNRQGDRVAPEEFVTPSPTPVPTPVPTPTAVPSPSPVITPEPTPTKAPTNTPQPTPSPTPTLSPYERALQTVPALEEDTEAEFKNRRSMKVYHGPSEKAYQYKEAMVTTDDSVIIYGQEDDWLLVGYTIGNGSKGRIAYIQDSTLNAEKPVKALQFSSFPIQLTRNAKATDDPLHSQETRFSLDKGENVTLLAFFEDDWAYIETTFKEKTYRAFIPVEAIQD